MNVYTEGEVRNLGDHEQGLDTDVRDARPFKLIYSPGQLREM